MDRERILQAARELFFKYGIKSITMDDFAKHLGISKKTIYQFFENKDQIVNTLTKESLIERRCQFEEVADTSENAIDEIMEMMKHMSAIFKQMNPNVFYDMQKYHPLAWNHFRDFKEQCIMVKVEENLKKGIKQGLYRKDIDTKIMAKLRIEQVEMAMNPAIFNPEKFKLSNVQVALLDHFLHGITTLKGHKLINKYKKIVEEE